MSGKPLGISLGISDGAVTLRMSPINRTVDQIWDAVREAININMTPAQFRNEVIQAWQSHLKDDAKHAEQEFWSKP